MRISKITELEIINRTIANTIEICRDYKMPYEKYGFLYELNGDIHKKIMIELEKEAKETEVDW